MKKITFSLLAILFAFSFSVAQNDYTIQFQDETIQIPENINSFRWDQMPEYSRLNNGYYGWIQKSDFPLYTKKVLTAIKLRSFNNKLF